MTKLFTRKSHNSRVFVFHKSTNNVFKEHVVLMNVGIGNIAFLSEKFSYPYDWYKAVSKQLANGDYKAKVIGVDNLGNQNTGVETTFSINSYPLIPKSLSVTAVGSSMTVSWVRTGTTTPTYFRVYGNGGSGNLIDKTALLSQVAGTETSATFAVADGEWRFTVDSVNAYGSSDNYNIVSISVPIENTVPPKIGFSGAIDENSLSLTRVSVGKVKIKFPWYYGTQASQFYIYHDDATGTIDYGSPKFSFTRQNGIYQTYTTTQLHTDDIDKTYRFVVRAVNSYGNTDGNTKEFVIEVDGVAPDDITSLVAGVDI